MSVNNLQSRFSMPQSRNIDAGMQQGGGGGGNFYMPQQEQEEEQNESGLNPFDYDFELFGSGGSSQSYAPPSLSPLERLLIPIKEAAARKLYFNYPKDADVANN